MIARRKKASAISSDGKSKETAPSQRAQTLLSQITYLHNEQISIQSSFLTMIYIPIAFLGVLIYYSYSQKTLELFLLLPFLFSWSISNIMKYTMKILGIGAYIKHLENMLNKIYNEGLFLWQSKLVYANGYFVWGILGQALCILVILGFLVFKFFQALAQIAVLWQYWILLFAFIGQMIILFIMAIFTSVHYRVVLSKIDKLENCDF